MNAINIPNGAILNFYLPKKRGNLKRWIMNLEAKVIKRKYGFSKLLNHTGIIEITSNNVLIWEASVFSGVRPINLELYEDDAHVTITTAKKPHHFTPKRALSFFEAESGKKYDIKSWSVYLKYLLTGRWKGGTTPAEYSKLWFCSEITAACYNMKEAWKATPNHVFAETNDSIVWEGTIKELKERGVTLAAH